MIVYSPLANNLFCDYIKFVTVDNKYEIFPHTNDAK
jgi:hypothetical protein